MSNVVLTVNYTILYTIITNLKWQSVTTGRWPPFGYIGSKLVVLWFYTSGSIYNKGCLLNSPDPSTTLVLSKFTHLLIRMLKGLCYLSVNSF